MSEWLVTELKQDFFFFKVAIPTHKDSFDNETGGEFILLVISLKIKHNRSVSNSAVVYLMTKVFDVFFFFF